MIIINPKTCALIFDCDGTIAFTESIHSLAWEKMAQKHNINIKSSHLLQYNGLPTFEILNILKTKHNLNDVDLNSFIKEKELLALSYLEDREMLIRPIKPVIDLIKKYHNQLKMAVISGGTFKNVRMTLKKFEIFEYFDLIITADDDHPLKNNKEAFTLLAEKLNVEPYLCHVFEDGELGLINAIKAGMMVTDARTFH